MIDNFRGLAVVEGGFGLGQSTIGRRLENIYRGHTDEATVLFSHITSHETEYTGLVDHCFGFGLPRNACGWADFSSVIAALCSGDACTAVHTISGSQRGKARSSAGALHR
ncbi:MAG TPA: hypothetical protein VJ123_04520 [Anaerolineales bacterium]|nr:hypothetical protein [Anaerolineales bacterium]